MNNSVEFSVTMKVSNDGQKLVLTFLNCGYNSGFFAICIMTENNKQYNLCYLGKLRTFLLKIQSARLMMKIDTSL